MHVQAHLDGDLSLDAVAGVAGMSAHHFQRVFAAEVGESLKQYTLRLRLERAAVRLLLHDATVLEIALDCGFANHETFTRAFRRHFDVTPRRYRARGVARVGAGDGGDLAADSDDFELSSSRAVTLSETWVAFIRSVGPYEEVDDGLFDRLTRWADAHGPGGDHLFFGIAHDPPGITPPEKQRFDCCVRVGGPFAPAGDIGCQALPSGLHVVTTHTGPFASLGPAYRIIAQRIQKMRAWEMVGLPSIELYRTTKVNADAAINHTEIYLPVRAR